MFFLSEKVVVEGRRERERGTESEREGVRERGERGKKKQRKSQER